MAATSRSVGQPASTKPDDNSDIDEILWTSPMKSDIKANSSKRSVDSTTPGRNITHGRPSHEEQQSKEAALRNELESVRKVNEAIEGVIESLEKSRTSMKTVNQTVTSASTLLNTWTRILSQTEHNQRLILNPAWQGASQDILEMEQEATARQEAAERRAAEDAERRAEVARKAEDEERRRAEPPPRAARGLARGRGRASGRGAHTTQPSSSGYGVGGGSANTSNISRGSSVGSRRTASGISRGIGLRAGRARGT